MLQIYRRLWQVNWAEQWQYRANLLMYLLYWLVSPIVYMAVWSAVANAQGSVSGFTANDFVTYYMTMLVVDVIIGDITVHLLAVKIQDGTLSGELLKPVHPILTTTLVNGIAFKALTLLALIPVWVVLALLFRPDYSGVTVQSLLLAVPAVVLGFAVAFLLGAALTCVAFWTTRIWSIEEFYWAVAVLFSGQFVPLDLMPGVIQQAARWLPFQLFIYFPVQLILGELPPGEIERTFALGVVWLLLAIVIFRAVWKAGVKQYTAVGA